MRQYFMQTKRIGFGIWEEHDMELAAKVWGEPKVTRYICASGIFTKQDIEERLQLECSNYITYGVQYFPIYDLATEEIIGACGLRPFPEEGAYEMGFHLRSKFWRMGFGREAGEAVLQYAWEKLHAEKIYAGHHPNNLVSKKLLTKLDFSYIGNHYYEPTGLYHPSYERTKEQSAG